MWGEDMGARLPSPADVEKSNFIDYQKVRLMRKGTRQMINFKHGEGQMHEKRQYTVLNVIDFT